LLKLESPEGCHNKHVKTDNLTRMKYEPMAPKLLHHNKSDDLILVLL